MTIKLQSFQTLIIKAAKVQRLKFIIIVKCFSNGNKKKALPGRNDKMLGKVNINAKFSIPSRFIL